MRFEHNTVIRTLTMTRLPIVYFAFVLSIVASGTGDLLGQLRDQSRLAVDVVYPKNQKPIRGFVLSQGTDELQIAVAKTWLEKDDPDAYLKAVESSQQMAANAKRTLRDRIQKLLKTKEQAGEQAVRKMAGSVSF